MGTLASDDVQASASGATLTVTAALGKTFDLAKRNITFTSATVAAAAKTRDVDFYVEEQGGLAAVPAHRCRHRGRCERRVHVRCPRAHPEIHRERRHGAELLRLADPARVRSEERAESPLRMALPDRDPVARRTWATLIPLKQSVDDEGPGERWLDEEVPR
jgi:hypothetical protein